MEFGILKIELYLLKASLKNVIKNVKQIPLKKNSATLEKLQLSVDMLSFTAKFDLIFCVVFVINYAKQANSHISLYQLKKIRYDRTTFCLNKIESHFYMHYIYIIPCTQTVFNYILLMYIFYPITWLWIYPEKINLPAKISVHQAVYQASKIKKRRSCLLTRASNFGLIQAGVQDQSSTKK